MADGKQGRPRKEIDQNQFEKLCGLQCTKEEFCCYFDCDEDTINNWCKRTYGQVFSVVFKQKRGGGKISLRRKQFEVALAGNPTMLIWLGRNYLDQSDKLDVTVEDKSNGQLADLIDGLRQHDLHEETTGTDAPMAEE